MLPPIYPVRPASSAAVCPRGCPSVMRKSKPFSEISLIKFVTIVNFAFAVGGLFFAFVSKSQSVLFDALYSFTSSFFTLISARVVQLVKRGDDRQFQFGYGSFEPLFIVIRTMFILTMNCALAYAALKTLLGGGAVIGAESAALYTLISVCVCAAVSVVLRIAAKKTDSPVLSAEAKSWVNDTLLSVSVLAAFCCIFVLRRTRAAFVIPYIDSGMTLLFIVLLVPQFVRQLGDNIQELLTAAPPVDIQQELDAVIRPYIAAYDLAGFKTYSTKRGRTLYIVVHVYLKHDVPIKRVDVVRKAMIRDIRNYWHYSDTDIVFTLDKTWIPLSFPHGESS